MVNFMTDILNFGAKQFSEKYLSPILLDQYKY